MTTIHPIYRTRHGLDTAVAEVLDVGRYAILGTENDDGSAHLTPVMYVHDDGKIYVETSGATRKARNVASRGRARILVLDPRAEDDAWVSGSGPAELAHGDRAQQIGRRVRGCYLTERGEEQIGTVLARYDDAAIVVSPDRWLAWDMTAFYATLADEGISLTDADEWSHPVGT